MTERKPVRCLQLLRRCGEIGGELVGVLEYAAESGEVLQRAMHAGHHQRRAVQVRHLGDDRRVIRDRARGDARDLVFRIDHAVIEIDHRCKVEIDAERSKLAPLPPRVLAHRKQPLRVITMDRDDLGERRHAGERWRQTRNRAAFLIGRDPERRETLHAASGLQARDTFANLVGRLALDIQRAEKHARDGAALEQSFQVG